MYIVSTKEIQALDNYAIERLGISSLVLMENAGRAVAKEILRRIKKLNKSKKSQKPFAVVFCGVGNNAGDGFVAARYLHKKNIRVKTYIIGKAVRLKSDAEVNYGRLKQLKTPVQSIQTPGQRVCEDIKQCDIVVDAIFGVGLNRRIAEPFLSVIKAVNAHGKNVVSIDIPSGLDSTTGRIYSACIEADTTVTFTFPKKGFYIHDGPCFTGRIVVADIGIPKGLMKEIK